MYVVASVLLLMKFISSERTEGMMREGGLGRITGDASHGGW